jgi:hypothetical protein
MVIANRFFTFLIFFVKKGSADDDAFVWDRGHSIPYPTNDASASSEAKHIYKPFRHFAKIGIFSFIRRFANIAKLTLSSFCELLYYLTNYFLSFSGFFIAERQVLTMMHLFGIGQTLKPYPTNMRQR